MYYLLRALQALVASVTIVISCSCRGAHMAKSDNIRSNTLLGAIIFTLDGMDNLMDLLSSMWQQ